MSAAALISDGRRAVSAAAVLRAVLDHGPVARSTIARLTGLSPAVVTRQTADFLEMGLLRAADAPTSRGGMGRPHIPLDIEVDRHLVGGVHIAHEYYTLAALDLRGRIRAQERIPHEDPAPDAVLSSIAHRFPRFLARRLPGRLPIAVGVATGGWVDPDQGVIVEHASLGWRDVPVREVLGGRLGLPVRADSHARALACAERLFGAAQVRASRSFVHVFVGNVVDAAIMTDGVPHRGPRSGAGDIAHLPIGEVDVRCGRGHRGCFEATVSDASWARRAVASGVVARPSIVDLLEAAQLGDPAARALFAERARMIGRAAALLFDLVNPDVLAITEAGMLHLPECLDVVRSELAARSNVCGDPERAVIATSLPGQDVLAVAGGAVELDAIYSDPLSLGAGSGFSRRGSPLAGRT